MEQVLLDGSGMGVTTSVGMASIVVVITRQKKGKRNKNVKKKLEKKKERGKKIQPLRGSNLCPTVYKLSANRPVEDQMKYRFTLIFFLESSQVP